MHRAALRDVSPLNSWFKPRRVAAWRGGSSFSFGILRILVGCLSRISGRISTFQHPLCFRAYLEGLLGNLMCYNRHRRGLSVLQRSFACAIRIQGYTRQNVSGVYIALDVAARGLSCIAGPVSFAEKIGVPATYSSTRSG